MDYSGPRNIFSNENFNSRFVLEWACDLPSGWLQGNDARHSPLARGQMDWMDMVLLQIERVDKTHLQCGWVIIKATQTKLKSMIANRCPQPGARSTVA